MKTLVIYTGDITGQLMFDVVDKDMSELDGFVVNSSEDKNGLEDKVLDYLYPILTTHGERDWAQQRPMLTKFPLAQQPFDAVVQIGFEN